MNDELREQVARALYLAKPRSRDAWEEEEEHLRRYHRNLADVVARVIADAEFEIRKRPERKTRSSKKKSLIDEVVSYEPDVDMDVEVEEEDAGSDMADPDADA